MRLLAPLLLVAAWPHAAQAQNAEYPANAVLAAAATTNQSSYPATEILDSFKEVCFTAWEYGDLDQRYAAWRNAAEAAGWTELLRPVSSEDRAEARDYRAFYQFKAVDHAFIGSMLEWFGKATEPASAIFKKQVANRTVYISVMATDGSNPYVSECRLHDPLGDGIRSSPISREILQLWSGSEVHRKKGVYGGKLYVWEDANGVERSVRVHFGTSSTQIPTWGDKFEPYEIYGLTLVASDYSLIYVT